MDAMKIHECSSGSGKAELHSVVDALCDLGSVVAPPRHCHGIAMPSVEALAEFMGLVRAALFPGYFGPSDLDGSTVRFHVGASLDRAYKILTEQLLRGLCFECREEPELSLEECSKRAKDMADSFMSKLPTIKELLVTDVQAAYEGDPAAKSFGETIFCYPSIRAMIYYRVAHELCLLGVPIVPRVITEMAHSATGIDIHPGASIGAWFFMDHGTGIVIGETTEIGQRVSIYQGVTLGAKSFPKGPDGKPIKGVKRHPIVEDEVIIYAGATILGRVRIGRGSVIGGNVWVTTDVPPGSRLVQQPYRSPVFQGGAGI